MIIRTRVFELYAKKYRNLSELAESMGLSVSQVYRVREGKRGINQKFIIGAKKAFPDYRLDELFYLEAQEPFLANGELNGRSGKAMASGKPAI